MTIRMMCKKCLLHVAALLLLSVVSQAEAATLKDPHLRDDDISATEVTTNIGRNQQYHYVYTYNIKAPLENTGRILTFLLDISCPDVVDSRGFNPETYPSDASPSMSNDGKHTPVAIDAPRGEAGIFGISVNNEVHWLIGINPGGDALGLQLISPYPPGDRAYQFIPSDNYRTEEWDYSNITEDDPVPWIPDWTVTGITTGPACPGEEYPDGDDSNNRYDGTPFAGEPQQLNQLLSYTAPLRDQFHLPAGSHEVEMTIHYAENIESRTFRVTPEKNQLRQLFHPRPGTSETVRIPLEPGKNRIELQAQSRFTPPGQLDKSLRQGNGREGVSIDRDVFVFRVPTDTATTKKR